MTTSELVTSIAREFREQDPTNPVAAGTTEIVTYLNWSYQDLCCSARPIRESATLTIEAEQSVYPLPSDCIVPTEIWEGDEKLAARNYYEKDDVDPRWRSSRSTRCEQYIPLGCDHIEIYPIKTTAGTLTFHGYYAMPATLSWAQDPEIPDYQARIMKKYVLGILHASKNRDVEMAAQDMGQYMKERETFIAQSRDGQTADMQTQSGPMSRTIFSRVNKDS